MTPAEFDSYFDKKLRELDILKIIYPAASNAHNEMTARIFDDGVKGDGTDIGKYSTTPAYYTKSQFAAGANFKARGKNSTSPKFKNGNPRKSQYFPAGYKGLRDAQGYPSDKVIITYSGDTRREFETNLTADGDSLVARATRNKDKIGWLSEKYGESLFQHTETEIDNYVNDVAGALTDYFAK